MRFDEKKLLLYAVADRGWAGGKTLEEQIEAALAGGVTCLQLRERRWRRARLRQRQSQ